MASALLSRVKNRTKELLEYFSKQYVLAYKSSLVQKIREAKAAPVESLASRPPFELIQEAVNTPPPATRLEGDVWMGKKFAFKVHWVMSGNYVITEVGNQGGGGCCGGGSAPVEPEPQAPPADTVVVVDTRVWVDRKEASMCANVDCSKDITGGKGKNCRQCGNVYCGDCLSVASAEDPKAKICKACDTAIKAGAPKQPLLKDPGENQRLRKFRNYTVSLHMSEQITNAGASTVGKFVRPEGSEGKFLLVMEHRRPTRPTITVAFKTQDQRDQWRALIQTATRKAPKPCNEEPLLARAFKMSYDKLRWHAGMWGWYEEDGTEAELLTDVIVETLEREFLRAELSKLPSFAQKVASDGAKKAINAAIDPAWSLLMRGLNSIRPPIEKAAASMLNPIFETENKLKEKIVKPMDEAVGKLMGMASEKLNEYFGKYMPIFPAFAEAEINAFALIVGNLLRAVDASSDKSGDGFWREYNSIEWRTRWSWSYEQRAVSELLYNGLTGADGSSRATRHLGYLLEDDGVEFQCAAFRALKKQVEQLNASQAQGQANSQVLAGYARQVFPAIATSLANDMRALLVWRLTVTLDGELRPVVLEAVKAPIDAVCAPLAALVPDLIKDVLDPFRTCHEIIYGQLHKLEKTVIATATKGTVETINAAGSKAAATGPK